MACGTLWGLSTKQEHRPSLAKAGAAPRVVRALVQHMEVEDVVLRALGTLRTLSSEMEVRQDLVALEAPQQVAKAMKLHRNNPAVQRDGCAFLSNSAVDVERQQVALATEGEVEAIIKAMAAHKNDPSVLTGATFALKNYSFMDRNVRTISACENAVSLLEYTMNNCTDSNGRDDAVVVLERIQTCFADDENLEGLEAGDFLFFGRFREDGSEKITHVGIYLCDGTFIHSGSDNGANKMQNLLPDKPEYAAHRRESLMRARRLQVGGPGVQAVADHPWYW